MKSYVAIAGGMPLLLVCGVAATNYTLDPYLIHQWQTPEVKRLRQPVEKLNAWGKTYAIALYRPETVYLGNSRTELGMAVPRGGRERVFNAALSGATVGDALRMLGHARQVGDVRTVIWGLDAPSFTLSVGNTELENGLLASDGRYLARRFLLDLQRSVSLDMSRESLDLLRGRSLAVCHPSLAQYGQRDGACMQARIDGWGGAAQVVEARTREFLRGEGPTADTLQSMESAIGRGCKLHWRLYVNPTHAMTIDGLYWRGKGARFEAWLADLAAIGARLRAAGCDVRVFDFSGFNHVTTEPVPQAGNRSAMLNYWETSHYRESVGDSILARIAGGAATGDGFGAELLPGSIEGHIAKLQQRRKEYLISHPYEAGVAQRIAATGR
ncbi:hypothetical protein GM658_25345 [Pseudoduganella eburnea]|uniref:Uncharacterized protein n=1 Tax=Massilia eburnea TaxID=1776165 RepID=A0A6L6QQY3_9BURK|nr:hypothetical protein [Massilia eburnea]MTW13943.1 hypothetical protein [Massilia eburnea]